MSHANIDKGIKLLRAIQREYYDASRPFEDKIGWSGDDLHELFDNFGFNRSHLFQGYFLRIAAGADRGMTVPPFESLAKEVVGEALELLEARCRTLGIPPRENS